MKQRSDSDPKPEHCLRNSSFTRPHLTHSFLWIKSLTFAIILSTIFACPRQKDSDQAISLNRSGLISILAVARPLEGRLSGGFHYSALEPHVEVFDGVISGYERPPKTICINKRLMAQYSEAIERKYKEHPTAQALADKAVLILIGQGTGRLHEALSLLEEAAARDPQNPQFLSDLAAGYLAWTRPDPPGKFIALEMASRAVHKDPALPEAQFNFALALERCALFRQARQAWGQYLRLDPQSGWAAEAHRHLEELSRPSPLELWRGVWKKRIKTGMTVTALPYKVYSIAREEAMEQILGQWASKTSEHAIDEAKQELELARRIGNVIPSDKTLHDEVDLIATANQEQTAQLCKGHLNYQKGMEYFHAERMALSQPLLESAAKHFALAGSPFEYWANVFSAEAASYRDNFSVAQSVISKTRINADLNRYRNLGAEIILADSLIRIKQGKLIFTQENLRFLNLIPSSPDLQGRARLYLAEIEEALGYSYWLHRDMAFRDLSEFPNSPYLFQLFVDLSKSLSSKLPETGALLLNEAIEGAEKLQDERLATEALVQRARAREEIGDKDGAQHDKNDLQKIVSTIKDPLLKGRRTLEEKSLQCQNPRPSTAESCIATLTESISYFTSHDPTLLAYYYKLRARSYHATGKGSAEEDDLIHAIEASEASTSPASLDWQSKNAPLFNDLISLLAYHNDSRAFAFTERSRGTFLPRPINTKFPDKLLAAVLATTWAGLRPYSSNDFSRSLPKGTAFIEYTTSGDQLSAWVFLGASSKRVKLCKIRDLPKTANRLAQGSTSYSKDAFNIYQHILRPLLPSVAAGEDIIFLVSDSSDIADLSRLQELAQLYLSKSHGFGIIHVNHMLSSEGKISKALEIARISLAQGKNLAINTHGAERTFYPTHLTRSYPSEPSIIEYKLLKDRLLIWVLVKGRLNFFSFPISNQTLENLTEEWKEDIQKGQARRRNLSEILYLHLIHPIKSYLPANGNLVIVPDGPLVTIPFAALRNGKSGKLLIEDYSISVAPSVGLYLAQHKRNIHSYHSQWTVSAVANPYSREQEANRYSLSGATSEAKAIIGLFPGSEMISDHEADHFQAYSMLGKHEIIHYAGHWDPWHPTYDGSLNPDSIPTSKKTKLVVLSGCNTTTERLGRKEYGFGIVQPLLERGVPSVIASLWDVDDLAAHQLLVRFYTHLRDGNDGANALRAAELDLLKGNDPTLQDPSKWGSFQLFGYGGI